jgi:hypothetical protein
MSWSLNVMATERGAFAAALDAAEPGGQDAPGVQEVVDAAKTAAKELAAHIRRPYVAANLAGHVLQPDEGDNWSDSLTINLYGLAAPQ